MAKVGGGEGGSGRTEGKRGGKRRGEERGWFDGIQSWPFMVHGMEEKKGERRISGEEFSLLGKTTAENIF